MMSDTVLRGRAAVVTGASRGIGAAIAKKLGAAGARVWITFRTEAQAAETVARDIESAGGWARTFRLEVTDRRAIADLAARIEEESGALGVLVNNAGVNKPTDFDQITDEDWDRVVSVNLKGPFLVTQGLLPLLRLGARRWGDASIVHIGSVSGQYGGPRTAHYAASKAGLISLAQVIARFAARDNVRSNTLCAGLIQSDMGAAGLANSAVQKAAETILLRRLGSHDDVAEAALFLASAASAYVTGQVLNVNGGLYF
jgi:3-oxoacyl-[acyl-carrier protein] reductase